MAAPTLPRRLHADETGATAIEYALLAGLIAVVLIGGIGSLGRAVSAYYGAANTELVEHMDTAPDPDE